MEAGVLDLQAAIHHDVEAGVGCAMAAASSDSRPSWHHNVATPPRSTSSATSRQVVGAPERRRRDRARPAVRPARRTRVWPRISLAPRVHEPHSSNRSSTQEVRADEVARPARVGRHADHGDRRVRSQDRQAVPRARRRVVVALTRRRLRRGERPVEVPQMSSTSSMPTEMRTRSGPTPRRDERFVGELTMRGGRRMDDERAGIADVGEVAAQLARLDEPRAGGAPARDARTRTPRPARAAGTASPGRGRGGRAGRPSAPTSRSDDRRGTRRPARALATWASMRCGKRLHPLQQQEGVER